MTHGPGAPSLLTTPQYVRPPPGHHVPPDVPCDQCQCCHPPGTDIRLMAPAPETVVSAHDVMLAAARPGLD